MNTEEAIYKMISLRVKKKKEEKGFTNVDVIFFDSNVVTNIVNNKRYKKNPYLLTPAYAEEIVKSLSFKDPYTLIWGNEAERASYFGKLFFIGINYLMNDYQEVVEQALYYYMPYAYELALKVWKSKHGEGIGLLLPSFEYNSSENNKNLAIQFLYNHYQEEFANSHALYFKELYTTKLTKKIKRFYETELLKILREGALFEKGKQYFDLMLDSLMVTTQITFDTLPDPVGVTNFRPTIDFCKSADTFLKSLIDYQEQTEGTVKLTDDKSRWDIDLMG